MARPIRVQYEGALYHVMSRGNNRQAIALDDLDFKKRLHWYQRTVETYGWQLHAFVIMTNHDHLFFETPQANLAVGMQYLNGSYTSYFNRRHKRKRAGHLFQGRYKAQVVDNQGYYVEVSRYIHLNPVRAKIVDHPTTYPWSSYPGYLRLSKRLPWMTYDRVLTEFGRRESPSRRSAYKRFVESTIATKVQSPFDEAVGGLALGSDHFVTQITGMIDRFWSKPDLQIPLALKARPSLDQIVTAVCGEFGVGPDRFQEGTRSDNACRCVAAYLGRSRYGYSGRQVAQALGYRSGSSVTEAVRRFVATRGRLAKKLRSIEKYLAEIT